MFEKEADEYTENPMSGWKQRMTCAGSVRKAFKDGAEFGYNKANEWHYVKDGDLPKDSNKVVLCICGGGFINGKINYVCRLLTRKEFSLFGTVYRWKEIVLPELKESE